MATTIKQTELDFFSSKLLHDKEATLYVRDREMFLYIGDTKLIIDDQERLSDLVKIRMANVILQPEELVNRGDMKRTGEMWYWQEEEKGTGDIIYILTFISDDPLYDEYKSVGIKFGRTSSDS